MDSEDIITNNGVKLQVKCTREEVSKKSLTFISFFEIVFIYL